MAWATAMPGMPSSGNSAMQDPIALDQVAQLSGKRDYAAMQRTVTASQFQRVLCLEQWRASSSRSDVIALLQKLLSKVRVPDSGYQVIAGQKSGYDCREGDPRLSAATSDAHGEDFVERSDDKVDDVLKMQATTLVLRNIPDHCKTADLLELWPMDGTWDFMYLPLRTGGKTNIGFAIINFCSVEHAVAFASCWQATCLSSGGRRLKIIPAAIQGLEANVLELNKKPLGRLRARKCDPVILEGGRRVPLSELRRVAR